MLTEFAAPDTVTAVLTSHLETGENFDGPISIGFYKECDEIWIEFRGVRINLQSADVNTFLKQIKRAVKLAENAKEKGAK